MKANLYSTTGKLLKEVTLPQALFDVTVKPELLSQAIHVYRSNQHQGISKVQTRGDVDRTTAKWYKQKGTGRARHGARSANIFVGGGSAHGPHGVKAADLKLNKKMRQLSLLATLSQLARGNQVSLVENLTDLAPKTKSLTALVTTIKSPKITLVTSKTYPNVNSAAKNLKNVALMSYHTLNAYILLNARHLVLEESTLDLLQNWLIRQPKTAAASVKEDKAVKAAVKPATKPAAKKATPKAATTKATPKKVTKKAATK